MIEAKRCTHNGYYMRSLTEGDWAMALDELGFMYQYEPEVIGGYLPDFLLTHAGLYLEIKPSRPTAEETAKAERLFRDTGLPVVIACGRPSAQVFDGRMEACSACFRVYTGRRWTEIPLNDISRLAYAASNEIGLAVVRAAMKRKHEAVGLMMSVGDRATQECINRSINSPLNQAKASASYVPGRLEVAVGRYIRRFMQADLV